MIERLYPEEDYGRCRECVAWNQQGDENRIGQCRMHAPGFQHERWPLTNANDWCCEWEPVEDEWNHAETEQPFKLAQRTEVPEWIWLTFMLVVIALMITSAFWFGAWWQR